jgi:hypothetical protein
MLAAVDTARRGLRVRLERESGKRLSANVGCRPGDKVYMLRCGAMQVAFDVESRTLVAKNAAEMQRRRLRETVNACDLVIAGR